MGLKVFFVVLALVGFVLTLCTLGWSFTWLG